MIKFLSDLVAVVVQTPPLPTLGMGGRGPDVGAASLCGWSLALSPGRSYGADWSFASIP
ncbi:hypothetical protein D9M72_385850 [compost metagenome]